jgi:Zn-dependent M32 family carboxypeptidase
MGKISSLKPIVKNYLEEEPRARERKNKNRGLAHLLKRRYPSISHLPNQYIEDIVHDTLVMDRAWRKILEDNENLRGKDYAEKDILEDEVQIDLEYGPVMPIDTKLKKIV